MRKNRSIPIAATTLIALFAGLAYLLAWSSIFTVSAVAINGAPTDASRKTISEVVNLNVGDKLARVEPRAISRRISDIEWVEDAQISRNWITGQVTVEITPRTPTAFFNDKVLDASGKVFSLPGFEGGELPRVAASTPELGLVAIDLFQALPTSIKSNVLNLAAYNESNFSLRVLRQDRELQILWGANDQNELKAEVINALLALPENKKIRRIDVSAPHAPIVK